MAMLKKTLFAAVACGTIALTASAFAQAGGAGGGGGTGSATGATAGAMGSVGTGMAGTTGTLGTGSMPRTGATGNGISGTSNNTPGTNNITGTNNTLAANGPNNGLGINNGPGVGGTAGNLAGTTGLGGTATPGGNGIGGNNNMLAGNRLALGGTTNSVNNNLGTRGPAGTTSVQSALATTPRATNNTGLSTAGGIVPPAGGNGFTNHRVIGSNENLNQRTTQRSVANHRNHEARAGQFGVGSNAAFAGLDLGNTATPVRGLRPRAMARVSSREHRITAELNRAELHTS